MDVVVVRSSLRTDEMTVVTSEGLVVGVDVEVGVVAESRMMSRSPDPPLPSFVHGSGHKEVDSQHMGEKVDSTWGKRLTAHGGKG